MFIQWNLLHVHMFKCMDSLLHVFVDLNLQLYIKDYPILARKLHVHAQFVNTNVHVAHVYIHVTCTCIKLHSYGFIHLHVHVYMVLYIHVHCTGLSRTYFLWVDLLGIKSWLALDLNSCKLTWILRLMEILFNFTPKMKFNT